MRPYLKLIVWMVIVALTNMSCANIFDEMADKDRDSSRIYAARLYLGKGDWDGAINTIALLSADAQARRDVKDLKASAYAGKCGLDFINLGSSLQSGGSALFSILLSSFSSRTATDLASCITAEDILKTYGAESARTAEENLLMAFIGLAKMGVIINARGNTDADPTTIDPGWSPCASGGGAADLPNVDAVARADATEMVTGFGLFITSLGATAAGSSAGSFFSTLNTMCASLGGACAITDRASVTGTHTDVIRALVSENTDGFGLSVEACDTATCIATVCNGI